VQIDNTQQNKELAPWLALFQARGTPKGQSLGIIDNNHHPARQQD
jgi:hypothetical protein